MSCLEVSFFLLSFSTNGSSFEREGGGDGWLIVNV